MNKFKLTIGLSALSFLSAFSVSAESVNDLSGWVVEDIPNNTANWIYNEESNSWLQTVNTSGYTYLYDPSESSIGKAISGTISVNTTGDDDYIGFVVGYNQGELSSVDSEYMLLTWKQSDQGALYEGMNLYLVQGALDNNGGGVDPEKLDYATNIGNSADYNGIGWEDNVDYKFDIAYQSHYLAIFVNDALQYAITPEMLGLNAFTDGGFGFFNYSQDNVEYGTVLYDEVDVLLDDGKKSDIVSAVPVAGAPIFMWLFSVFPFLAMRKRKVDNAY